MLRFRCRIVSIRRVGSGISSAARTRINGRSSGFATFGIGSATLPYGAWQRASKTEILSAETVVLFGLYWTTFLAVGYVPVHLTMHQVGLKIRDEMVREWRGSESDCAIWDEPREKVSQALGLSDNPLDFPKSALAVLTPLFSGILSIMIAKAG